MRASGDHGRFQGREYEVVGLPGPRVRLYASGDDPCPEGFESDRHGRWTRLVDVWEVSGPVHVDTTADWRGHPVRVARVTQDVVHIEHHTFMERPPGEPEVSQPERGAWAARVPPGELADVTEVVTTLTCLRPSGVYALLENRMYRCEDPTGETLRLYGPASPPSAVRDLALDADGRWSMTVHRARVTRLVQIDTSAVWRGNDVTVARVAGDVAVVHDRGGWPPPDEPEVTSHSGARWWRARVAVDELTGLSEVVTELSTAGDAP